MTAGLNNWSAAGGIDPTNVAITGGTISGVTLGGSTNAQVIVAKWGIPFFPGVTGSMANNGVVTWGSALLNAYIGGAWVHMPAASIAAGVPAAAAWLWYVGTDTTHGTFFNSTYTTGTPTAGTATAFATTGPGAFTGETTQITGPTITVPGNTFGTQGRLVVRIDEHLTNSANGKTLNILWGATDLDGVNNTSASYSRHDLVIRAQNSTSLQASETATLSSNGLSGGTPTWTTLDATASQTVTVKLTRATATENQVLASGGIYAEN